MSLTIQNLTKSYGANIAVNDISFRIDSGEVVGFLGPNGAGKSTTMKIITGCISADSGTVLIDDIDISTANTALKHKIGYLPENNPLYLNMYVREYLEYSAAMYMPRSETLNAVNYAVDAVGLGEHQYKKIGELSKGYRQRTGIARAMVHNPGILILDEPTRGIDVGTKVDIQKLVLKLASEGMSITFISSETDEMLRTCSRLLVMRDRKLVGELKGDELTQNNIMNTIAGGERE